MLAYLTVRNFALVADLELHFVEGLTVITGESGAGKSILLDALGLVLGQRASAAQIRPNADECEVSAEFNLHNAPQSRRFLEQHEFLDEDDPERCIVRRVATVDGRSRAWVNGTAVNLRVLRELCTSMVATHDQFAQHQLLSENVQLAWFDDFVAHPQLSSSVETRYRDWRQAQRNLESAQQEYDTARDHNELLQFQVTEFDEFQLQEHEFEELSTRYKRLSQTQSILATLNQTLASLEESAGPNIGRARNDLGRIDDTAPELSTARELLDGVEVGIDECLRQLRAYSEVLTMDEDSLDEVTERLDRIHEMARKHRVPSAELYAKAQELQAELDATSATEHQLKQLKETVRVTQSEYDGCARKLSKLRSRASKPFVKDVLATLNEIGMSQARFEVKFTDTAGPSGLERIEFAVSANSRYEAGPLKTIASGGELSRISLAILVVVASNSKLPCLILDEADIGVGGTTADEVGRMLRRLSAHTQVVCVTHAPQVAALGDAHIRVRKTHEQDVAANDLTGDERVEEIARMVAGHRINAESRKYASVLLKEAQAFNQEQTS